MRAPNRPLSDVVVREMVQRILRAGDPQKVVLFGSRARGNARPDSDYDLLVIESSSQPRYKRAAKYRRALIGVCPAKDVLVWTPKEVAEWRNVPNAFINTVLNEGLILYERPARRTTLE